MEWWQIFGVFFLIFLGLFVYSSIARDIERKQKKEKLLLMADPYKDGDWKHPSALARDGKTRSVQQFDDTDDENESFITRLPKVINRGLNQKLDKLTLKDKVEIGELQVEHITNANEYADQFYDLETKSKTNQVKTLKLDKDILEAENDLKDAEDDSSLRNLRKKDARLDYDISIAEKEARLNEIKNPKPPPKPVSREEAKARELAEVERKIAYFEDMQYKLNNDDKMSEEAKQIQLNQIRNKLFELYGQRLDLKA